MPPNSLLSVLSFNTGCREMPDWAPWVREGMKYKHFVELVARHKPHLLAPLGYELVSQTLPEATHNGLTAAFARESLGAEPVPYAGPVAVARLTSVPGGASDPLYFCACHLIHRMACERQRRQQVAELLTALPAGCRLILAGDCNMLAWEGRRVEAAHDLRDAYRQCLDAAEANMEDHCWTWDMLENGFHVQGTANSLKFPQQRYDRIYLRGLAPVTQPGGFRVVAKEAVWSDHSGRSAALSDHYAVLARAEVPLG
ncbi:hypothetical protein ABPG75_013292 [Micractinium tetrahymenae]